VTYDEWERTVPQALKSDALWRVQAYRLAHFLAACAALDTRRLLGDPRFHPHIDQLCRATASVSSNIAEGYPSESARDRARFYGYALKSLAESKSRYLHIRPAMEGHIIDDRFALMLSITRLLRVMIRRPRGRAE
jgi:four helix bundle protein